MANLGRKALIKGLVLGFCKRHALEPNLQFLNSRSNIFSKMGNRYDSEKGIYFKVSKFVYEFRHFVSATIVFSYSPRA